MISTIYYLLLFQDELNVNDTTRENGVLVHENEIGRQQYTKDDYKGVRQGSELAEVEGKSFTTHFVLVDEEGNPETQNRGTGQSETYGNDEIHEKENSTTANGIRGQASIINHTGAANESNIHGATDRNSKTEDVGDSCQSENATVVKEDEHQLAGSNNGAGHEDGINGNACGNEGDTSEIIPQREGGRNGNEEAGVTPRGSGAGNRGDVGLENSGGSPSGDGADEDEDEGSGGGEGEETGNGKETTDNNKGQEGEDHGKEDDEDNSLGQNSISSEDDDGEDKEDPRDMDGDNASKSQEDSDTIPEDTDGQRMEDTQRPYRRENTSVENKITKELEPPTNGKSQDKVSV